MQTVLTMEPLLHALASVKGAGNGLVTNWFLSMEGVEARLKAGDIAMARFPGTVFLAMKEPSFSRLHHVSSSEEDLERALGCLGNKTPAPCTVDLIGNCEQVERWSRIYERNGFSPYRVLVRMSATELMSGVGGTGDGLLARLDEVSTIHSFLANLLDPFTERIPTRLTLEKMVKVGTLLRVMDGEGVAGVLAFERVGISCILRYWFVSPCAKGQGYGSKLMKAFLNRCRDCRKATLWVFTDNHDSISKYEHYGFHKENVFDVILVRGLAPGFGRD